MGFDELLGAAVDGGLYGSLRNYIAARIELLLEYTLSRNLSLALTIIGALFTLWIMVQGYLILTGRSQENLKTFIFNLGKTYIIILVALGVSSTSEFSLLIRQKIPILPHRWNGLNCLLGLGQPVRGLLRGRC